MDAPKLFISYCWSNPSHEQWVLELATALRESGVDVILDKWDLKEGHDSYAFMEKMVTDSEIKKVAIIFDQKYADKADDRTGGVGTETQIISKEVYEKQDQEKFVAIVAEKDELGSPYLPTYYKPRIYIDLSEPDTYSQNFEQLLRWIFDQPLHIKPEIGSKPAYLDNEHSVSLGTTALFRRVIISIQNDKRSSSGNLDDYLDTFSQNLERFRIEDFDGEFDDVVINNIEEFIPFRDEFIQLIITMCKYSNITEYIQKIHRFFEKLLPFMDRPSNVSQWRTWDFDNFKFIVHELFLYVIAILLKYEKFEQVSYLLEQKYYLQRNVESGRDVMVSYLLFYSQLESLDHRKKRLKLNRVSLQADLLKERCNSTSLVFRDLMQVDFVLFMRAELMEKNDWKRWWPITLIYLGHFPGSFEIFSRSVSKKYFDKMKIILGINNPDDLDELFDNYNEGTRRLPQWGFNSFNPKYLIGYDKLAQSP